ncbi:MAG: VWA domain-containing protein [Calditrichia bacterium]
MTFLLEDIKVDYSPVYSRIFKWWSEELLSDHWQTPPEFAVSKRDKTDDIVLVLDVSNSLGGDFYWVKEYAKDFLDIIYTEMRDNIRYPKIAIVDFSTDQLYPVNDQTIRFDRSYQRVATGDNTRRCMLQ